MRGCDTAQWRGHGSEGRSTEVANPALLLSEAGDFSWQLTSISFIFSHVKLEKQYLFC